MLTKLPKIIDGGMIKDYLTKTSSTEELAEKYGYKNGHSVSSYVRLHRKTPKVILESREDTETFLGLVTDSTLRAHWLGLSPSKTESLVNTYLAPDSLLEELYVDQGMSNQEIVNYINNPHITYEKIKNRVKKLHLHHKEEDLDKIRARWIKDFKNDATRINQAKTKRQATMLERYGVNSTSPLSVDKFRDKAVATVKARYGGMGMQSHSIRDKVAKTSLERYGVTNHKQSIEEQAKHINWHETPYVHSAKEALELIKPNEVGVSDKLLAFLEELVDKGEFESFSLKQINSDILGLNPGYLSNKSYNLHPDGKLIINDYRVSQNEVVAYLESLGIPSESILTDTYPKFMDGKQLDIYLPEYNFGIEYNGSFWHASEGDSLVKDKPRNYHLDKTLSARKEGISLMHVWDYDWKNLDKQAIVKSQIKYHLSLVRHKYYARKLVVKETTYSEKVTFLKTNHIQGDVVSSENYGLYNEDELVAVMTFGKRRFDNNQGWELLRFATKLDSSVAGGASKLLKAFTTKHKGEILISYANNDFAYSGNKSLYKQLGFTYVKTTVPGYKWVNTSATQVVPRYSAQVHKLKAFTAGDMRATFANEVPDYSATDTETTYMVRHGFYKVYDAGNDLYELNM